MELIIIAAVAENRVIGKNNQLPWRIPEDLQRFKKLTQGHAIIMGRKTYESIGKPLPKRRNMVITRQTGYAPQGVEVYHSLDEAIQAVTQEEKAYVIGGQQIYELALPLADRLEITEVHKKVEGDAYFPNIDSQVWKETLKEDHPEYSFITYVRR